MGDKDKSSGAASDLALALHEERYDEAEELLKTTDINAGATSGATPMLSIIGTGSIESIRFLLERGADPNVTTMIGMGDGGHSPLHSVVGFDDQFEIMKLLIEYGADVNLRSEAGETPLDIAVSLREDPQVVAHNKAVGLNLRDEIEQYLIDHGAKRGDDPLADLPTRRGGRELERIPSTWALILARADAERIGDALEEAGRLRSRVPNMMQAKPKYDGRGRILGQLKGYEWTHVLDAFQSTPEHAKEISRLTSCTAIHLAYEDTSAAYSYVIYDVGDETERFEQCLGDSAQFKSSRRQVDVESIDDPLAFVDATLKDLDAYASDARLSYTPGENIVWAPQPFLDRTTKRIEYVVMKQT